MIKDAANNFLFDPIKDEFTNGVMDVVLGNEEENDLLQFLNEEVDFGEFDLSGLGDGIMDEQGGVLGAIDAAGAEIFGDGDGEAGGLGSEIIGEEDEVFGGIEEAGAAVFDGGGEEFEYEFAEAAGGFLDGAGELCTCLCDLFCNEHE